MPRRLANITLDNLTDLPHRCRKCVFWELDPVSTTRAQDAGDGRAAAVKATSIIRTRSRTPKRASWK
ncbi:MAG TPA: hypothetical protein VIV12_06025 [Streptosporangiaceae bacterium]